MNNSLGSIHTPPLRRHRPDFLLLLFIIILVLLGLIIIFAISPALTARINAGGHSLDQNHFMYRQLIYLGLGITAFVATSLIPISFWQRVQGKIFIGALLLGIAPFILQATPIGLCTYNACRWLDLGFITFQPAEVMKLTMVLFIAGFLTVRIKQQKLNDVQATLVPLGIILMAMAIIVIGFQRDLGTGLTIIGIASVMIFIAGIRLKYLAWAVAAILAMLLLFTISAPHRIERILTFINHSSSTGDAMGYHINQALIAVGSGGLSGKGLGQSIQAFGYLPEAANDSIFAILAEKFGFIGTVAVLLIFAALFIRILATMDHSANIHFKLITAGVFGWVFSHTIINIGAMLGIFPLTGITLPFVSFGGTSLIFMLSALGIVFQISRYTSHTIKSDSQTGGNNYEDRRRGRGIRRTRDAGARRFVGA